MTTRAQFSPLHVAQTLFWGVGYFIGFTLVGIAGCGLIRPGVFAQVIRPSHSSTPLRRMIYRENHRIYLAPQIVSLAGWCAIFLLASWFWRLS